MTSQTSSIKHSSSSPTLVRERKLSDTDKKVDLTQSESFKRSIDYVNKLSPSMRLSEEKKIKYDDRIRVLILVLLVILVIATTLLMHYYYPPIK